MVVKATAFDAKVGQTLKRLRSEAGHSQPTVARFLGIKYQSYQDMEAGRVSLRASTLDKLATLYSITLDQLLEGAPVPNVPNMAEIGSIAVMVVGMGPEMAAQAVRSVAALGRQS